MQKQLITTTCNDSKWSQIFFLQRYKGLIQFLIMLNSLVGFKYFNLYMPPICLFVMAMHAVMHARWSYTQSGVKGYTNGLFYSFSNTTSLLIKAWMNNLKIEKCMCVCTFKLKSVLEIIWESVNWIIYHLLLISIAF